MLVGREPAQGLEPTGIIVGVDEQLQVGSELLVGLVMVALDGGVLDGSVHPLDLTVGPGMVGLGQTMLDAVLVADAIEHVPAVEGGWAGAVARGMAELHPIVGQHGVDLVGHERDQRAQEVRCGVAVGLRL